jgi:murein DD-endopeptidase MepM/ murein hydrolase activator NlpD
MAIALFSVSTAFLSISSNINAGIYLKEKRKSVELDMSLKTLQKKIDSVDARLASVVALDDKERLVWGLPEVDEDVRKLGIGGRRFGIRNSPIDRGKESIEKLRRRLDFEVASFGEIYHKIKGKKRTLLHTPSIWPTKGTVTSRFGWRWLGGREFHKGLDIANSPGTAVVATASGVVNYSEYRKGLGLVIEVDHGFGYKTRYGHLARATVKPGQSVERGQQIGTIGMTGRTTGPHLHYEVKILDKQINPSRYIIPGTTTY